MREDALNDESHLKQDDRKSKSLHFALVMVISWLMFMLGTVINQLIYSIYQTRNFDELLVKVLFLTFPWGFLVIPWSGIVFLVFRNRKVKRWRTALLLGPSVVMLFFTLYAITKTTYSSKGLFQEIVIKPVPESISNLKAFGTGGGFGNPQYLFYFDLDPQSFDTILKSRPFKQSEFSFEEVAHFHPSKWMSSDWPNLDAWKDVEVYNDSSTRAHYRIITTKDHRRVFFEVIYM